MKSLQNFLCLISDKICESGFISVYRNKSTFFSRSSAKLTFDKLVIFLLSLPKQSAQNAINHFIKESGYEFTLHKQSLFEAREKLSHRLLIDLNSTYFLPEYAYVDDFKTYRGFRIIAVDGSVFDVPHGADWAGGIKTANDIAPKAQVVAFTDVMNEYIVKADFKPYGAGETNVALAMFRELWSSSCAENNLFLLDRGFFSQTLAKELYDRAKFVFRVSSASLREINSACQPDQIVNRGELRLRVINYKLPNGQIEKLVTNIFDDSFTVEDFAELYRKRWGVETCFLTLKQRLQIENFLSSKKELVLQDFYSSIFVYNIMIASINEADVTPEKSKKYDYKANKSIAIVESRDLLIGTFLEDDPIKRQQLFMKAMETIQANTVPIRPNPSYVRKVKHKSAKFHINDKGGLA